MAIRQIIVGTALAALGVLYLTPVLLPDAEAGQKSMLLDEHWLASDPDSKVTIEHDDWQAFLDTYLEVAPPYDPSLEVTYANERSNRRIFAITRSMISARWSASIRGARRTSRASTMVLCVRKTGSASTTT